MVEGRGEEVKTWEGGASEPMVERRREEVRTWEGEHQSQWWRGGRK